MEKENNELIIPFVKAVRVGNYKLWRSKKDMEFIHVSNLDGSWKVQIPSTSNMFGFISQQYATIDKELRENFLGMVFTNMLNISLTPSPALHDSLFFLTDMLSFPYLLLPEKEMVKRMEKGMKVAGLKKEQIKEHISEMVKYRSQLYDLIEKKKASLINDYERQQAAQIAKEDESLKELEQAEIAEQAIDVINKESEEKKS